jgi:hypothetical protein
MKQITIKDIRDLNPSYNPSNYLPEDWTGAVEDILLLETCPIQERIWTALKFVPKDILETFALDCAIAAAVYADYD